MGGKKRNERNTKETNCAAVHYLLYMAYETFRWLVQEEKKPTVKISFMQPDLSPNVFLFVCFFAKFPVTTAFLSKINRISENAC